jgi:hypothetical protein
LTKDIFIGIIQRLPITQIDTHTGRAQLSLPCWKLLSNTQITAFEHLGIKLQLSKYLLLLAGKSRHTSEFQFHLVILQHLDAVHLFFIFSSFNVTDIAGTLTQLLTYPQEETV